MLYKIDKNGFVFHTGTELAIWVCGGLVMIVIGLLNRKAD